MHIYIRHFSPFRAKILSICHAAVAVTCGWVLYNNVLKQILVTAEEFIGKDFRRSRNNHSTLQDPLFAESKATTWKVLCRKSGMLVGSCYSCSVAVKCGGGGIVWVYVNTFVMSQSGSVPWRLHSHGLVFRNKRFHCTRALHRRVFGRLFGRQNKCCYHRALNRRYSVARVVATSRQPQNL